MGVILGPLVWRVLAFILPPLHPFCLAQASAVPPTGVRFPESCQEEVRDQKQLLKDAAAFLLSCQIPGLVREGPQGWGAAQGMLLKALVLHPSDSGSLWNLRRSNSLRPPDL